MSNINDTTVMYETLSECTYTSSCTSARALRTSDQYTGAPCMVWLNFSPWPVARQWNLGRPYDLIDGVIFNRGRINEVQISLLRNLYPELFLTRKQLQLRQISNALGIPIRIIFCENVRTFKDQDFNGNWPSLLGSFSEKTHNKCAL